MQTAGGWGFLHPYRTLDHGVLCVSQKKRKIAFCRMNKQSEQKQYNIEHHDRSPKLLMRRVSTLQK